jgi:hypothetical protein
MVAPDQPDQRGHQHHHPGVDRHHRRGHMQEDDLDRRSLAEIVGREEEAPDQPNTATTPPPPATQGSSQSVVPHELQRIGIFPKRRHDAITYLSPAHGSSHEA